MKLSTQTFVAILSAGALLSGCGSDDDDSKREPTPEPENTAPEARAASFVTQADTPLSQTLEGTDADGDGLNFSVQTPPQRGELAIDTDGSFMYTPPPTYTGMASFSYSVSDGEAESAPAQVDITVEAQMLSYSTYSREAFNQSPGAEPLPVNGRDFEQDVTLPGAYDDLLQDAD